MSFFLRTCWMWKMKQNLMRKKKRRRYQLIIIIIRMIWNPLSYWNVVAQVYFVPNWAAVVPKNSFEQSIISSGVCQFWKKRKQWSTSPTITWSPWRWPFSKHTKWRTRERKEYWQKFSFILVSSSLLFVFSLLWIGKYLEDKE